MGNQRTSPRQVGAVSTSATSRTSGEYDAVVVLQMGGPARLRDVRPFLANLFSDRDIIRFPDRMARVQPLFAQVMATLRSPLVWPRYRAMGGGSPLNRITSGQAEGLSRRTGLPVHVAMRYTLPDAQTVVRALRDQGAQRVLVLPLYPHWSHTTSGSSLRDLARALDHAAAEMEVEVVPSWGDHEEYARLVATMCLEALEDFSGKEAAPVHLVLSAHSLPKRYIEEGDPYERQVEESVGLVRKRLGDAFASVRLAYQSRVGPVEWIGPETDDVLEELADEGAKAVLLAPFGFVSDHIETLYDLDRKYRKQAKRLGISHYERVPSFNTDPRLFDLLGHLVAHAPKAPLDEVIGAW